MKMLTDNKKLFINDPLQLTEYRNEEMCVNNKVQETIADMYSPTGTNKKCAFFSTKKRLV